MSTDTTIEERIERAATAVGQAWPLHSFVTANPLAGFEDRPFHEAVAEGERLFGGRGYPSAAVFRRAWAAGHVDRERLTAGLAAHGYDTDPEASLDRMAQAEAATDDEDADATADDPTDRVDQVLSKWLATFLDQGSAEWPMPDRDAGFYTAVRELARYDSTIPDGAALAGLPDDPVDAITTALEDVPADRWEAVFEHHLAALPGWTGFIRQQVDGADAWQSAHPITLAGYLAIRLELADQFGEALAPVSADATADDESKVPLPEVWLDAWEATYREELVDAVSDAGQSRTDDDADGRPAAQLVFCIDTRSEVIRRHVEAQGDYETHGYAGFFGIPMRYEGYESDVSVEACPPILDAQHRVVDRPVPEHDHVQENRDRWTAVSDATSDLVHALKTNAATAFNFVETTGLGYSAALAARTLLPARVYDALETADERVPADHEFCEPTLDHDPDGEGLPLGMTHEQQVEYAANAFELMGWQEFGRLVVFTGHAGQTANNPFDSSLDCGACAGNPGGPNARVLAAICNDSEVRDALRDRGIDVPDDTVFVAGEHNTTTDEVTLYDGPVPESHADDLEQLRADLAVARSGATAERTDAPGDGVRETQRRAADWAETRPEWGLAGNAGFVIGPRALTEDLDLDGRSFLHSYDPATDPDGSALEAIMTGPMVVTQWINCQYYFATVDTAAYGSGSKVTHNPVGNVGVYQGNGGDLLTGLPLQSVMADDDVPYHQPLRLSVVVAAPVSRVTEVLDSHDDLATLLDNGWLSLTVVDPEQEYRPFHYDGELAWTPDPEARQNPQPAPEPQPVDAEPVIAADDD